MNINAHVDIGEFSFKMHCKKYNQVSEKHKCYFSIYVSAKNINFIWYLMEQ